MTNKPGHCLSAWLLSLGLACSAWQSGCTGNPTPTLLDQSNDEIRFRTTWDQAQGRLHYDELVRAWGPPTELRQMDDTMVAHWQWEHAFPLPLKLDDRTSSPAGAPLGSFGERLELTFSAKTKLLLNWKYSSWGPQSAVSQRGDSSPLPPPQIRN